MIHIEHTNSQVFQSIFNYWPIEFSFLSKAANVAPKAPLTEHSTK